MGRLFEAGVTISVISLIPLLIAFGLMYNAEHVPLPQPQVKLIVVFVFTGGLTMAVVGISCIVISAAIGEEIVVKGVKTMAIELSPEIIKGSILVIIVVGVLFALILGKLSPEYFMQIISAILGMVGGAAVSNAISRLFRKA